MTYYTYDFYKYVASDVPMVPMPTVEDTVADVIIDFCQQTSVYRQWLEDQISVYQDDEEVELDLPADTAVVEILGVQKVDSDGNYGDFIDAETYIFSAQGEIPKLLFNEPVEQDFDARVRAAIRPVIGFTEVPDFIYEDWRDVIVNGAKARLFNMKAKPWHSPVEAEKARYQYNRALQRAGAKVLLETINKVHKPASRYI